MYLQSLVSLVRVNPQITDNTISVIDDFLGQISENGVFRQSDLTSVLSQKKLAGQIISYLLEVKAIEAMTVKCKICGREDSIDTSRCDQCGNKIDREDSVYRYRLIQSLSISPAERAQRDDARRRLLMSSFRILCTKIEKKKKTEEPASIVLMDLANSTELAKKNVYLMSHIKKEFVELVRDIGYKMLRNHAGHFLKSDGDSVFLYLNDPNLVVSAMANFLDVLSHHPCIDLMRQLNAEGHEWSSYIKIYHSSSKVVEYFKPDELSLEFTTMDAFVMNNRIEKKVKTLVESHFRVDQLFPFFFCSTLDLAVPNATRFVVEQVQNLGSVPVFVSLAKDFNGAGKGLEQSG